MPPTHAAESAATEPGPATGQLTGAAAERRPALVEIARSIEADPRLDGVVAALRPLAEALVRDPRRRDLLLGRRLGHALHPLLTDAPLGAWGSATLLDLVGGAGSRPAARRLTGLGVLAALPTAVTGAAELAHTDRRTARVGGAHALANSAALVLHGASWLARRRGHHGRGVVLGLLGTATVSAGGFLGAHLAIARNVGSRDAAFAASLPGAAPEGPDRTLPT